jgi:hypothetical protein
MLHFLMITENAEVILQKLLVKVIVTSSSYSRRDRVVTQVGLLLP